MNRTECLLQWRVNEYGNKVFFKNVSTRITAESYGLRDLIKETAINFKSEKI